MITGIMILMADRAGPRHRGVGGGRGSADRGQPPQHDGHHGGEEAGVEDIVWIL